ERKPRRRGDLHGRVALAKALRHDARAARARRWNRALRQAALARAALLDNRGAQRLGDPFAEAKARAHEARANEVFLEVELEHRGRRVTIAALDLQGAQQNVLEEIVLGEAAIHERRDFRGARLLDERNGAARAIEAAAREKLPKYDAGGEHIGARIDRLAARVLGAHVAGFAFERVRSVFGDEIV